MPRSNPNFDRSIRGTELAGRQHDKAQVQVNKSTLCYGTGGCCLTTDQSKDREQERREGLSLRLFLRNRHNSQNFYGCTPAAASRTCIRARTKRLLSTKEQRLNTVVEAETSRWYRYSRRRNRRESADTTEAVTCCYYYYYYCDRPHIFVKIDHISTCVVFS